VTGGCEAATIDWVEAARDRCDPRALEDLWAAVPEPMRLSRFAESSVPPEYAGAFCHDGTWRAGVDLSQLPEPMRREVAWCVFRIIELGGKIPTPGLSLLVRRLGEMIADSAGRAPASLLGLPVRDWCQQIQRVMHRRSGRLPAATTMNNIRRLLTRMMRLLVTASDTGPWWQRDQWNPVEDNRIPLRDHEPMGRYSVRFDRIGTWWLRRGLQWHCKVGLDTGVLSWSTVHRRIVAVNEFDGFLAGRGADGPWLADHPGGMRALMLDFLGHLRARPVTRGRRTGQRLSPASVQRLPCGDYGVILDQRLVASVERKSLVDLVASLTGGKLRYAMAELAALPRATVVVEDRYSKVFKLDRIRPALVADGLAELQIRWPNVPIVFCETRQLAEEWTYRFLAAAHAWAETEHAAIAKLTPPGVAGATTELDQAPAPLEPSTAEVRAWARAIGLTVPDRGKLRPDIWDAWRTAHAE